MFIKEFPPISNDEPSSKDIWAVAFSAVLTFIPVSKFVTEESTSQSEVASKRTPVAPISGFNKIGGTTNSSSLKTSTLLRA